MEKVLLGMSGGVDSAAAAIILKRQGLEVVGVTMKLLGNDKDIKDDTAIQDAKKVCDTLGIEHVVVDYSKEFKEKVIGDFINKYNEGKTPNPCIVCNKYFKFGMLWEKAKELGCKYIATGHYAIIERVNGEYILKRAVSKEKDQSYVLYNISRDMIPFVKFPLGTFESKDEIRKVLEDEGLEIISKKKDSQDICFIPDNDHIRFLEGYINKKEGNIAYKDGTVLGKHLGTHRYTIGQRRGLGVSYKSPLYVMDLDNKTNSVIVGNKEDIFKASLIADNINLLVDKEELEKKELAAKVRYSSEAYPATVKVERDKLKIEFKDKVKAITKGQSVVVYDNDRVVAGGEII